MKKEDLTISNILTISRFILAPVIMYFILNSQQYIALALFLVALLTDALDGYLARKLNQSTRLGKILDPISDKILLALVILAILIKYEFYGWIIILAISIFVYAIFYLFFIKREIKITRMGKIFLVIEILLLILMIFGYVNHLIIYLFVLSLSIPGLNYLYSIIRSDKK